MNTCKDCIHYEVCQYHIDEETTMTVNECSHEFKHKDQYMRLPAFVGQPVWHIKTIHKYENGQFKNIGFEVEAGKVSMLQQKADKSWKIRITSGGSVGDYTLNDFTNCIFTVESEAVKERDKRIRELIYDR